VIKDILSIQEVIEKANIPPNSRKTIGRVDDNDVYRLINRFYKERGDINPETYIVKNNGETKRCDTTLGKPLQNKIPIDRIKPLQFHHSHFSSRGLDVAGIDRDQSWNGEKAGIIYQNGVLKAVKTDYYSTKSFGAIPRVEAAHVIDKSSQNISDIDLDDLKARNSYLKNKNDIHRTKWISSGGTVGGVILCNTGNTWKIILGRRSDRTNINPGRISIIPNGALRYDNMVENGFVKDLKLHFNEELFRGQKQPNFFNDFVDSYRVSSGWNLRSGEFTVGYALIIRDPQGYEMLNKLNSYNFEFNEIVEIDVNNPDEITRVMNMENMSPSVIPTVFKSVVLLENITDELDLDYNIEQEI
jgi:hypothetical protein